MNPSIDSFVTDFTVRYYEGRRTSEAHLVDFEQLRERLEAAGGLAMVQPDGGEVRP
jgi:hypothetical protein